MGYYYTGVSRVGLIHGSAHIYLGSHWTRVQSPHSRLVHRVHRREHTDLHRSPGVTADPRLSSPGDPRNTSSWAAPSSPSSSRSSSSPRRTTRRSLTRFSRPNGAASSSRTSSTRSPSSVCSAGPTSAPSPLCRRACCSRRTASSSPWLRHSRKCMGSPTWRFRGASTSPMVAGTSSARESRDLGAMPW